MNGNKAQAQIPDFRREDDVWVRTPEEKGTAFLERFLRQTDQDNEEERSALIRRLMPCSITEMTLLCHTKTLEQKIYLEL